MIGSAVPLHLAQVETFAILIWRDLNLTTEPARVWVRAWPLLLVAIAAKYRLPVHFIGVGEGVDDLAPFAARDFARAIAGIEG